MKRRRQQGFGGRARRSSLTRVTEVIHFLGAYLSTLHVSASFDQTMLSRLICLCGGGSVLRARLLALAPPSVAVTCWSWAHRAVGRRSLGRSWFTLKSFRMILHRLLHLLVFPSPSSACPSFISSLLIFFLLFLFFLFLFLFFLFFILFFFFGLEFASSFSSHTN